MELAQNNAESMGAQTEYSAASLMGASALSEQFAKRGLARSVQTNAKAQIDREKQTHELDPMAYRLSELPEETVEVVYRRGKENMSSEDVLRYFRENRNEYLKTADMEGNTGIDACTSDPITQKSLVLAENSANQTRGLLPKLIGGAVSSVKEIAKGRSAWLDFSRADTSGEKRRFPFSAFAAVIAVAMSLMLIVAGTVMVTRAQGSISSLKKQIDVTSAEVAKLKSDFEVQNDMLEIRRIAIEEYGMVDEDFVDTDYIELSPGDSVESFEEESKDGLGLSGLLSAIGIK